jgi:hypothetical protein
MSTTLFSSALEVRIDIPDFTFAVSNLSLEEKGAYICLLLAGNQRRGMPDDDAVLGKCCGITSDAFRILFRAKLETLFYIADSLWFARNLVQIPDDPPEMQYHRPAPPSNWDNLRTFVFRRDGYACVYCGDRNSPLECDHIVPLQRGGSYRLSNLATACVTCNRAKGARLLPDWKRS